MPVKAIPEGYHAVTPYLVVPGVAKLIDFLKQAFQAEETMRMAAPDGGVMHAEVKIGDSRIMMGEPGGQWKAMPTMFYIYVTDADAVYRRAMQAGATSVSEPADQPYGDRNGTVRDASGNLWCIGTRKEELTAEEIERRMKSRSAGQG
jgi:PhnB protein